MITSRTVTAIVVCARFALWSVDVCVAAGSDLDLALARDPAEVVTHAGRSFRGTLDGFRDGRLHMRHVADGGEVGYSFAPSEIARFTLPGAELEADALELLERDRVTEAMPMLEALGRHRVRYLPVLTPAQQTVLWRTARAGSTEGDPHAILGIVRAMAPLATTDEARALLIGTELEVLLRLHATDEIEALARRWCALADASVGSALGWRVLAEAAYQRNEYDQARWIALQPITFSGHLPMGDLDRCYMIAIASADRLGDATFALALWREMETRSLAWPLDPAVEAVGRHYATAASSTAATLRAHLPAITPSGNQAAASTTLQQTRKLVTP